MYSLKDLQAMKVDDLKKIVKEFELDNVDIKDKSSLYFNVLNAQASANGKLFAEGVIEIHSESSLTKSCTEYPVTARHPLLLWV